MMYYISKVNAWNISDAYHAVTLDYALIMAERLSRLLEPDTNSFPRMMVWTKGAGYDVKAIATKGVARMVEKCQNESKWCKDCEGFGWKESGKDRG